METIVQLFKDEELTIIIILLVIFFVYCPTMVWISRKVTDIVKKLRVKYNERIQDRNQS